MAATHVLLMAMSAWGPQCTQASDVDPPICPLSLPKIAAVAIERNGATIWKDDQARPCREFRLSKAQVRTYFLRAKATPQEAADATLARSGCVVTGRITFANGKSAEFQIERYGAATLFWSDGKTVLTYCPTCTFPPFAL